jgi:ribonuclease HII
MLPGVSHLPIHGVLPKRPDFSVESVLSGHGYASIAGVDEVGRGCLAGPVVAAAVVLPEGLTLEGLNDSKQMAEEARLSVNAVLREKAQVGLGSCSAAEIDRWNILRASLEAMRRALIDLGVTPDFLLVDGNQTIPGLGYPQQTVVKGDARCLTIAAASVVAKVERDHIMTELDRKHPEFGWSRNVGYPTGGHFEALSRLGPSPYHRRSFRLRIEDQTQMKLF